MNVAKLFRHPEIKATKGISSSQSTSKPNCKYKLLRNINIICSSHALIQLLIEKKKKNQPLAGLPYYSLSKSACWEHGPDQELFQPCDGFVGPALKDASISTGLITSLPLKNTPDQTAQDCLYERKSVLLKRKRPPSYHQEITFRVLTNKDKEECFHLDCYCLKHKNRLRSGCRNKIYDRLRMGWEHSKKILKLEIREANLLISSKYHL